MTKKPRGPSGHDPIDENLRSVYRQILEEPVPDRFRDLLEQLRSQDATKREGETKK